MQIKRRGYEDQKLRTMANLHPRGQAFLYLVLVPGPFSCSESHARLPSNGQRAPVQGCKLLGLAWPLKEVEDQPRDQEEET
jgi:hypothetical protein